MGTTAADIMAQLTAAPETMHMKYTTVGRLVDKDEISTLRKDSKTTLEALSIGGTIAFLTAGAAGAATATTTAAGLFAITFGCLGGASSLSCGLVSQNAVIGENGAIQTATLNLQKEHPLNTNGQDTELAQRTALLASGANEIVRNGAQLAELQRLATTDSDGRRNVTSFSWTALNAANSFRNLFKAQMPCGNETPAAERVNYRHAAAEDCAVACSSPRFC